MKAIVRWAGDAKFELESETGHTIIADGPADMGGKNLGPRPMELVLMGAGACSSIDVVHILKKARQDVTGCVCELQAQRVDDVPAVFESIHLHFVVTGHNLRENQVKRAVELSAEKYCSASIMLARGGVKISHGYEIREA
ncbi:OsmC-like protein [gamma proteobacterium HdN1]|nr:OsmC-like protein [gamma proteobacterium HdN1]